jgi:hypothetical protein
MKTDEMMYTDYLGLVPEQTVGKEILSEESVTLKNINEAKFFFQAARRRLLDVNRWHEIAEPVSAHFQAFDQQGNMARHDLIEKGNLMRVDIPGPGSNAGNGYDWVHAEELKEYSSNEVDSVGFRVRPCAAPNTSGEHVAHFYNNTATSSFILTREGTTVTASIVDRNLQPNDDHPSTSDKIRNVAVAVGAIGAFSKIQWENLVKGIVKMD